MTFAEWSNWAGIGAFFVGLAAIAVSMRANKNANKAVKIADSINSIRVYGGGQGGEGGLGGGGGGAGGVVRAVPIMADSPISGLAPALHRYRPFAIHHWRVYRNIA
jgi:hypothetical protein